MLMAMVQLTVDTRYRKQMEMNTSTVNKYIIIAREYQK